MTIRNIEPVDRDFDLMEKWLTDPKVLEYYEGRDRPFSRQEVVDEFVGKAAGQHDVFPCIAEYDGIPIGYVQYYELDESDKEEYGVAGAKNVYGMDLFIGETSYWNQGIGTLIVKAMLEYLFKVKRALTVFIDPQAWNERAIRCYEKSGFRKIKLLPQHELHEGVLQDNWLMEISPKEFQG